MPEEGWASLTVRERVGAMIKALARSRGLTVSDRLERLIAAGRELKVGEEGSRPRTCRSIRLRYIQEAIDSQSG
jgi:hypothetical protein